jgi:hypothetical protein
VGFEPKQVDQREKFMADIPIGHIEQMFEGMKNEAGWNTAGELLWGYFFVDREPKKLEPLAAHLVELGYRFVSIYETDDKSTHFLHVERIEMHTPESLFERNLELNALAKKFGVEDYDGMDVGPVNRSQ